MYTYIQIKYHYGVPQLGIQQHGVPQPIPPHHQTSIQAFPQSYQHQADHFYEYENDRYQQEKTPPPRGGGRNSS